jgi:2-polyprenyl-3-methyl-5-hydroxy-6-metoxy-1,4-benzoquinol methylase
MNYRSRLYNNYVSANKQIRRDLSNDPIRQDKRNIKNLRVAMRSWLSSTPKQGKVLDIACGSGNILQTLQAEGFQDIYGVDISPEQVALAKEQFPQVICLDAMEFLKQHCDTFTLITAFDILEHFPKTETFPFLDAIYNALKPGGRLILQLPNGDSPFAGEVIYGDFTHEVIYTTVSLRHVLISTGFSDIEFQEHCPQLTSVKGIIRSLIWSGLRQLIRLIHLVETGGPSTTIYTRVMRATALKPNHY